MIVEITTDVLPYDVVISSDKPGVINVTPNLPITVIVDVKKDGIDGTDGLNGRSAYEIWIDDGNVGTESEFVNSTANFDMDILAYYQISKL